MRTPELTLVLDDVVFPADQAYREFLLDALGALEARDFEVSVTLCRDATIHELNRRWRGKDEPTDVLSFESDPETAPGEPPRPPRGEGCYGDLVISMDTLRTNSAYFSVDWQDELKRVSVHGFLHLMGWDHATTDASEPMLVYQERVLERFKEREF